MFLTELIGHFHPLLVHLPIGILLFAFALILLQRFSQTELDVAIKFALLLGSISAVLACVAGWFLAQSGEYDADLVFNHQWMGIITAIFSILSLLIKRIRDILTTITVCFLALAGHFGGNLTHGENYLFPKINNTKVAFNTIKDDVNEKLNPITEERKSDLLVDSLKRSSKVGLASPSKTDLKVDQSVVKQSFVYRDVILPILESKCYSCHSATKKKGGLRLDSEEFIQQGGKNGIILTAGNPEKSNLYLSLLLPEEDDLHMPPKGKPQLTTQEIEIIHQWIKQGASFQEVEESFETSSIEQKMESPNDLAKDSRSKLPKFDIPEKKKSVGSAVIQPQNAILENVEASILKNKMAPVPITVLDQLKQKNVIVSSFGEGSNYFTVNFVNVKNYNSKLIDLLQNLGNHLIRLRLSNQPVSDSDIKKISELKNITRLNLEKTNITDLALTYFKDLPNLEQINLYGTDITDNGLLALVNCAQLKSIFLWQTKVTPKGVEELKKSLPHLQVELGGFQFVKPDSTQSKLSKL